MNMIRKVGVLGVLIGSLVYVQPAQCVSVLSSEFRIWGDWLESGQSGAVSNATFEILRSNVPGVTLDVRSNPSDVNQASASIDAFSLHMNSSSAPWQETTYGSHINIYSVATTRFLPGADTLQIRLGGYAIFNYSGLEQDIGLLLRDVTGSTTLLDFRASSDWGIWTAGYPDFTFTFPAEAAHEYEFSLSGWITAWDSKSATLSATAELLAVPEPPASSLAGIAACATFAFRRRRALCN